MIKNPCGIVVRPEIESAIRRIFPLAIDQPHYLFQSVPIYTKIEQPEDVRVYYNENEMREYLLENPKWNTATS